MVHSAAAATPAASEIEQSMNDAELWNLKFGVNVSALYHAWRRATLEWQVRLVRGATFVGAVLTLLTAGFGFASHTNTGTIITILAVVAILAVIIACVNLIDLVADFDGQARQHAELYRRFVSLQEHIAKEGASWKTRLPEWEAEALAISRDEPPTLWAVYAMCWNQEMERHQLERKGHYRPISRWQHLMRNFIEFKPQDFPAAA
jgi:hypothetical protein